MTDYEKAAERQRRQMANEAPPESSWRVTGWIGTRHFASDHTAPNSEVAINKALAAHSTLEDLWEDAEIESVVPS